MKRILSLLLVSLLLAGCTGSTDTDKAETSANTSAAAETDAPAVFDDSVPEIVRNTKGGEKWNTPINYNNGLNWLNITATESHVDLIYFYPTVYTKASADAPDVCDINDKSMRDAAPVAYQAQAMAFSESCNIFAPYYRQVDEEYAMSLSAEDSNALFRYCASKDAAAALDFYFEYYNNGKPFILAGHSQGSRILTMILSDYMKEHPEHYEKMVAAYVIGYSVTEDYMNENPHLKFAEGADDTGVIISYNTEGPGNKDAQSAVVTPGTLAINPINWMRDGTYASVSENLGSLDSEGNETEGYADARVDTERGVVVCESADASVYAVAAPKDALFGPESFHGFDYSFYYKNLGQNAADRIAAFTE